MNTCELKEYLRRVYLLEQSLFQQRSMSRQLQVKIGQLDNYRGKELQKIQTEKLSFEDVGSTLVTCIWICAGIAGGVGLLLLFAGVFPRPKQLIALLAFFAAGVVLGVILGIVLTVLNKKKLQRKNEQITRENNVLRLENEKKRAFASCQSDVLKQELQILDRSIQQTEQTLTRYYDKDIIFLKYRELVAVSSFYEYMASGRCSTLEGHEGAYNIFEMESRQDLILRKLDDIITRLDRIEENQYMLYTAIQNSNQETNRMLTELNRTAQSIESNGNVTAYNSRITAQNTECLKWLAMLQA